MEVIEIPGYTLEEKEKIATRYVIPKVLKSHGLKSTEFRITKESLKTIMTDYAREPGMRVLQQMIEKLARKAAVSLLSSESKNQIIHAHDLSHWLGPKRFYNEAAERISAPGVVVGLAWTAMGGDILFIEATMIPGAGQLKLTGQMGEVMTESASIAWSYVKKKLSDELKVDQEFFKNKDIHLHIPAGAIPKDGPSAGVTMASALYSLFSGRMARQKVAMTGELSLIGKVLPVGGIKEKILAAKRSGITTVILPKQNQKDMMDIPRYVRDRMDIRFVSHVEEVFEQVLLPKKVLKKSVKTSAKTNGALRRRSRQPSPIHKRQERALQRSRVVQ
jgi:ATP-dependent Lon protease